MTSSAARTAGTVALIAASAAALAGCGGAIGARLTFSDTEKVKVTEIRVTGGSGDVKVGTAATGETRINRILRTNAEPGQTYSISGTVLTVDTDCGPDCSVSYEIEAPAGVAVTGKLSSGSIGLTGTGPVDVTVRSGEIQVRDATGPVKATATSGDIDLVGGTAGADLTATSGNIRATEVAGAVTARATSGDIELKLAAPGSVKADASSGNISLIVPSGGYRMLTGRFDDDNDNDRPRLDGVTNDPRSPDVLDLHAGSGDVRVVGAVS